jgi:hypothetical protein
LSGSCTSGSNASRHVLARLCRSQVAFCHSRDRHAVWEILLVPTGALRPPVMHIHSPRSSSIDLLTIACTAERLAAAFNEALRLTPVRAYGPCLLTCMRLIESYDGCLSISGITTTTAHISRLHEPDLFRITTPFSACTSGRRWCVKEEGSQVGTRPYRKSLWKWINRSSLAKSGVASCRIYSSA